MFDALSDDGMLPHNRARAKALLRKKRKVAVVLVAVGLAAIFLTPPPYGKWAWVIVLSLGIALMGIIEVRRVLIFRDDLRERRASPDGPDGKDDSARRDTPGIGQT